MHHFYTLKPICIYKIQEIKKAAEVVRKKFNRTQKRHQTCPNSEFTQVLKEEPEASSNTLQVPNPNFLHPGDPEKGFKSVSLNDLSSDSITSEDGSSIQFPSNDKNLKNRLRKDTSIIKGLENLEGKSVAIYNERREKCRFTNFVRSEKVKIVVTNLDESSNNEEMKIVVTNFDESQDKGEVKKEKERMREIFYVGSNGDSTPHLYVDYKARLNGLLLLNSEDDEMSRTDKAN